MSSNDQLTALDATFLELEQADDLRTLVGSRGGRDVSRQPPPYRACRPNICRYGSRRKPRAANDVAHIKTADVELIAQGMTNAAIAQQQLVFTEGAIKWHVKQILAKTNSANRAEAIARQAIARVLRSLRQADPRQDQLSSSALVTRSQFSYP